MVKISIITVCFNSEKTLPKTLESIKNQKFDDYEFILIDGVSEDNTINIAKTFFDQKKIKIISESDNGIFDAMNKGIALSTGEIICILNSDDIFFNEFVLQDVNNKFISGNYDIVYGNLVYFNSKNRFIRKFKPGNYYKGKFYRGWHPPHPSVFVKRKVYEKIGTFNEYFRNSADFEFLLRAFELNDFSIAYLDKYLVKMKHGGASTGSLKSIIRGLENRSRAFKMNNIPKPPFYSLIRLTRIAKQYLSRFENEDFS